MNGSGSIIGSGSSMEVVMVSQDLLMETVKMDYNIRLLLAWPLDRPVLAIVRFSRSGTHLHQLLILVTSPVNSLKLPQ